MTNSTPKSPDEQSQTLLDVLKNEIERKQTFLSQLQDSISIEAKMFRSLTSAELGGLNFALYLMEQQQSRIDALEAENADLMLDIRARLENDTMFQWRLETLQGNLSEHIQYGYVERQGTSLVWQRSALGEDALKRIKGGEA